jgi:hypothetical protein
MAEAWTCYGAEGCSLPQTLGPIGCEALGQLGLRPCAGKVPFAYEDGSVDICPTPSDLTVALAAEHPNVPESMIHSVVWAVADRHISFADLPRPTADRDAAAAAWGEVIRLADHWSFPGQQD